MPTQTGMNTGRDHLRVCGADRTESRQGQRNQGSPPRARSRLSPRPPPAHRTGITSACAEQTWKPNRSNRRAGDHLRVCGADNDARLETLVPYGSPPRVRSRPARARNPGRRRWITSACAEQTCSAIRACPAGRDHLRVCGADGSALSSRIKVYGSPPRVRSRPWRVRATAGLFGITSACAEQTHTPLFSKFDTVDHLRVCGADTVSPSHITLPLGSPPRVRSRPYPCNRQARSGGITSACAEQTFPARTACSTTWDHLRVCGADTPC